MKKTIKLLLSFFMIMAIIGCTTNQNNEVPENTEAATNEDTETIQAKDQEFHLTEHTVRYYYQMPYTTDFVLASDDDEIHQLIIDNGVNVTINAWDLSFINEENTLLSKGYYEITSRYNTNYEGDSTRDQVTASWQVPLIIKTGQKYELQISGICESTYFNDVSFEIYDDSYASPWFSCCVYATSGKTTDAIDTVHSELGEKMSFGELGDMDFSLSDYIDNESGYDTGESAQDGPQTKGVIIIELPEGINDYKTIYVIVRLTPNGIKLDSIYYYYIYQLS